MATQTAEKHFTQRSRSPSHRAQTNKAALLRVAICLVTALIILCLLRYPGSDAGGSQVGFDDNTAWVIGL